VLGAKPSKNKDQKLWNACAFACRAHYSELTCNSNPLFLYGVPYSPPTPASAWTPQGVKASYVKKCRIKGGYVKMMDADMSHVAGKLVDEGERACVLNMANDTDPGGRVWSGKAAQEEELCRRNEMPLHAKGWQNDKTNYPLKTGKFMCHCYVLVCRAGEETGYAMLKTKFHVDILSTAAHASPMLEGDGHADREERKKTKELVESL
jgi:hypothetical protein